jgi:hypothetical protein
VAPLIIGEMLLEFIPIAHSPPQYQLLLLRPITETAMPRRPKSKCLEDYHVDE